MLQVTITEHMLLAKDQELQQVKDKLAKIEFEFTGLEKRHQSLNEERNVLQEQLQQVADFLHSHCFFF